MLKIKSSEEIRRKLLYAIKLGKIKGKVFGDRIEIEGAKFIGHVNFIYGCVMVFCLLCLIPFVYLFVDMTYASYKKCGYIVGSFIPLLFVLYLLIKTILVIDLKKMTIYFKTKLFGFYLWGNTKPYSWQELQAVGVDVYCLERKHDPETDYRKCEEVKYIKFDMDILKERDISLLDKYFDYDVAVVFLLEKNKIIIVRDGYHFSNDEYKRQVVMASALSEAFGIPLSICETDETLKCDKKNPGHFNIVPMFSENDFLKMEQEVMGKGKFRVRDKYFNLDD